MDPGLRMVSRIAVRQPIRCVSDCDDPMSKVQEEVQNCKELDYSQDEMPGKIKNMMGN